MREIPLILPYTSIVGQEELKLAIELNYVNPKIGGVLIEGERGTAKSLTVRAFSWMVNGKFPVTLPINATEDRVIGSYRIDSLLRGDHDPIWQKGLLQQASDNGVLYVDEVNLLDDHIINLLLDAASTGILVIQRENKDVIVTVSFGLIGTMNPEEGSLRPQLLDRFGLCVIIKAEQDIDMRKNILKTVINFDYMGTNLYHGEAQNLQKVKERLEAAKNRINNNEVEISSNQIELIARIATKYQAEGHRGDHVIALSSQALAALEGRDKVLKDDIVRVAAMSLRHRLIDRETRERIQWDEKILAEIMNDDI